MGGFRRGSGNKGAPPRLLLYWGPRAGLSARHDSVLLQLRSSLLGGHCQGSVGNWGDRGGRQNHQEWEVYRYMYVLIILGQCDEKHMSNFLPNMCHLWSYVHVHHFIFCYSRASGHLSNWDPTTFASKEWLVNISIGWRILYLVRFQTLLRLQVIRQRQVTTGKMTVCKRVTL